MNVNLHHLQRIRFIFSSLYVNFILNNLILDDGGSQIGQAFDFDFPCERNPLELAVH